MKKSSEAADKNRYTGERVQSMLRQAGYENPAPDICARLSLLSRPMRGREEGCSHFRDAVEISRLGADLVEELREKQELSLSGLLHDVGKSGPVEATFVERQAFVTVFNFGFYEHDYNGLSAGKLTLRQALEVKINEGEITADEAERTLSFVLSAAARQAEPRTETRLNPETAMENFWAAHVYWTAEILKDQGLPKRIIEICASHHLLDGHDPLGVNQERVSNSAATLELADKYQEFRVRLIMADQYQALRARGQKTHEEAVQTLRAKVKEKLKDKAMIKDVYLGVLDKIMASKNLFERELKMAA